MQKCILSFMTAVFVTSSIFGSSKVSFEAWKQIKENFKTKIMFDSNRSMHGDHPLIRPFFGATMPCQDLVQNYLANENMSDSSGDFSPYNKMYRELYRLCLTKVVSHINFERQDPVSTNQHLQSLSESIIAKCQKEENKVDIVSYIHPGDQDKKIGSFTVEYPVNEYRCIEREAAKLKIILENQNWSDFGAVSIKK